MAVIGIDCISFSETVESVFSGVPDGNGICFTDKENEIMSFMLNKQTENYETVNHKLFWNKYSWYQYVTGIQYND